MKEKIGYLCAALIVIMGIASGVFSLWDGLNNIGKIHPGFIIRQGLQLLLFLVAGAFSPFVLHQTLSTFREKVNYSPRADE